MIRRSYSPIAVAAIALVLGLAVNAFAQDANAARPLFVSLPPHSYFPQTEPQAPVTPLPQWIFSFTSTVDHRVYTPTIVGTDPSTNTTTTIRWGIIPIKMVYGSQNGNMTFDPNSTYAGNMSAVQMILHSPVFQSNVDFVQGGTDLGKTQFGDAYERGNFWGTVQTNRNYHLLFAPAVIAPTQTINVSASQGSVIPNPFGGGLIGTMDIFAFDAQLQTIIKHFKQIQPNVLPVFLTYNVYLTQFGGCCIGGYHSATGIQPNGQTYAHTTTISQTTHEIFSEDTGALSHEIGEWIVDPFVNNPDSCGGTMEVGDPLENKVNNGYYPYTIGGFTYHLQDLVFMPYFGAPTSTSLDGWTTFQNEAERACQDGQ